MSGTAYSTEVRQTGNERPVAGITTTLYDLVGAIQEEARPGEEAFVTDIVLRLMDRGRMKFLDHVAARSARTLSSV